MLVGIFADTHDHLDNIRRAVTLFNDRGCEAVLFAGDIVSTFAVPPLRRLNCPFYGCFGDNEGNRPGLVAGLSIIGKIQDAPASYQLADGTRVVIVHMERQLIGFQEDYDVLVYGHTHKPSIGMDEAGRLRINPGETSGWTYGQPTVAIFDTAKREAEIVPLDLSQPLPSWNEDRRRRAASATPSPDAPEA